MENSQAQQLEQGAVKKKGSFKKKALLFLVLLFIGLGIYGYLWYQKTNELRYEAQSVIESALKFDVLQTAVNSERERCKNFITQEVGDFGSFEYCQAFIQWANSLNQSN